LIVEEHAEALCANYELMPKRFSASMRSGSVIRANNRQICCGNRPWLWWWRSGQFTIVATSEWVRLLWPLRKEVKWCVFMLTQWRTLYIKDWGVG